MKKLTLIGLLAFACSVSAQQKVVIVPQVTTNGFALVNPTNGVVIGVLDQLPSIGFPSESISNIIAGIDESSNLFTHGEFEMRLGGVYVQQTGDAGVLIAAEKWDIGLTNLGIGAELIQNGQRSGAEFLYVGYRKLLGNTAGVGFVGGGYDEINKKMLGVIGARLEHRTSKHVGIWTSVSYGIEPNAKNSRGLVTGAGVSYAF